MPPPDSNLALSDEERKLLDRWIEEGAPYDTHWSLKPLPKSVDAPSVNQPGRETSWINLSKKDSLSREWFRQKNPPAKNGCVA